METASGAQGVDNLSEREKAVVQEVLKAVRATEYGSVLITIHQGEVVGIETARKLRLAKT
jgi:hypothetical protein